MERNIVLAEFLGLRKLLNQQNKVADVMTEFRFQIARVGPSECRIYAVVFGGGEENKIEIVARNNRGYWERSGYTNFINFENYCADFLNNLEEYEKLGTNKKNLLDMDLAAMISALQKNFDNLTID